MKIFFKYLLLSGFGLLLGLLAYYKQPVSLQVETLLVPASINDNFVESMGISIDKIRSESFLSSATQRSGLELNMLLGLQGDGSFNLELKPNRSGDAIYVKINNRYFGQNDLKLTKAVHRAVVDEIIYQQNLIAFEKLKSRFVVASDQDSTARYSYYIEGEIRSPKEGSKPIYRYFLSRAHLAYESTVIERKILPSKLVSILIFIAFIFMAETMAYYFRKSRYAGL